MDLANWEKVAAFIQTKLMQQRVLFWPVLGFAFCGRLTSGPRSGGQCGSESEVVVIVDVPHLRSCVCAFRAIFPRPTFLPAACIGERARETWSVCVRASVHTLTASVCDVGFEPAATAAVVVVASPWDWR